MFADDETDLAENVDDVTEEPPKPPTETAVLLVDLKSHHCRWPLWESFATTPEPRFYCGKARDEPSVWCPHHRNWARVKIVRKAKP